MFLIGKDKYPERIYLGTVISLVEKQGNPVTVTSIKVARVGFYADVCYFCCLEEEIIMIGF